MAENQEILSCDDNEISWALLEWSDTIDLWRQHEEILSKHDFLTKILKECEHVDIETEEWDADFPGRSGLRFRVYTDDAEALRVEIRQKIEFILMSEKTILPNQKLYGTVKSKSRVKMSMSDSEKLAEAKGFKSAPIDHPIYSEASSVFFLRKRRP